ncbi:hypothetical protein MMC30_009340 [Trapelia coarctata]|nr:hypothetical protein [Trapelia coarctata]
MPSGSGNPAKNPPGGRRPSRGNPKKIVQSDSGLQDSSSQSAQPERRRTPRKCAPSKNAITPDQSQTVSLAPLLTAIQSQDTTFDGASDLPAPASQHMPVQGTPSKPQTYDRGGSATPNKRNNRSPRPEHRTSNLMTPIKSNTPPVQAYAGPRFHASPAPSALPIPRMFSKSVPVGDKTTSLKAMMQDASSDSGSNKSDDSPTLRNALQVNEAPVREASPLDIFFNADRAEKARLAAAAASSPSPRSPEQNATIIKPVSPIPQYMRNHSRHNTGGSVGGMFPLEMDASEKPGPPLSHRSRPSSQYLEPRRSDSSSSIPTAQSTYSQEQAKAKTLALKQLLFLPVQKEDPRQLLPAMPIPVHIDIAKRLHELNEYLNPNSATYQPEGQHRNIHKVIELYKSGAVAGQGEVCVIGGKVVGIDQMRTANDWVWLEVCRRLLHEN